MSFEAAAAAMKESAKHNAKLTDDELLQLYALYKQGTIGDCNTDKPGFLNFK
jgi:diazepam-binding inhibitor (GABA receptor modulating acyl-CoA-binding protein)